MSRQPWSMKTNAFSNKNSKETRYPLWGNGGISIGSLLDDCYQGQVSSLQYGLFGFIPPSRMPPLSLSPLAETTNVPSLMSRFPGAQWTINESQQATFFFALDYQPFIATSLQTYDCIIQVYLWNANSEAPDDEIEVALTSTTYFTDPTLYPTTVGTGAYIDGDQSPISTVDMSTITVSQIQLTTSSISTAPAVVTFKTSASQWKQNVNTGAARPVNGYSLSITNGNGATKVGVLGVSYQFIKPEVV